MLMRPRSARWREAARRVERWTSHPLTVPLLLAAMLFAIGAHVACVFSIPSWSNDEPAHIGYIATLADGRLPTIDSPSGYPGRDQAHDHIWTANHPPAFHLLMVPVWWLASGDTGSAVVAIRLANTVGFAVWLLLVGMIARELVPRRPAVPALATVVALAPTLALRSGFAMNDGLGSAAALLMTLMTVRMLRGEVTPRRVAVAALAGAVAAGTRAPGVLIVAACFVTLLVVGIRRHGWLRGTAVAGVVGAVPAAASGWFYVRNRLLYGDLTGQDALLEKFQRAPVDSVQDVLGLRTVGETLAASPVPLFALLALAPLAIAGTVRRTGARPDAVWLMLGGHAVLTAVNVARFMAAGGGFHDRYFMQVMPVLATLAALGMLHVGRSWRRDWLVATAWTAVLLAWLAGALWFFLRRYSFYEPALSADSPVEGVVPVLLLGVAVLAGLAVITVMASRAVVLAPAAARRG